MHKLFTPSLAGAFMMLRTCSILLLAAILPGHFSVGQAFAAEPAAKAPVPKAEEIAAAKSVSEIYKKELDAAKLPAAKLKLAAKVLDDGVNTPDNPAARYVLYRAARTLALGAGNAELALKIADQWATDFAVDRGALQREVLQELAPQVKTAEDAYVIVRLARRMADTAAAADQFDSALGLVRIAADAARRTKDPDVAKQCEAAAKRIGKAAEQFQAVRPALAKLEQAPTDAAANALAGKFYCFVQGNFERGIAMLALGDDAILKDLAARDLQGTTEVPGQLALGDAWYEAAQKQPQVLQAKMLARAAHWYRQSPQSITGLAKVRIEKRLAESDAANSPFHAGEWVELLDYLDVVRDRCRGDASWEGTTLVLPPHVTGVVFLPVAVEGSFELRVRATSEGQHNIFAFALPFSGHEATVVINSGDTNHICSIWNVNGLKGHEDGNSARHGGVPTTPGQPYTVDVHVEKKGDQAVVALLHEGKRCLAWQGVVTSLSRVWDIPESKQRVALGGNWKTTRYQSVRFKLLSGSARLPE